MDNKYYIPTLEEFHVGFRFESYSLQWTEEDEESFDWEEVELDGNLEGVAIDLADGLVRVKYLDQSDLEELGWKGIQQDVYERVIYRGDKNYCWQIMLNHPPEVYIRSYLMDSSAEWMPSMQFRLVIDVKNFDEMKKLMQMFQIA